MRTLQWMAALAMITGFSLAAWAQRYEEPTAKVNFVVVKDYNGKPIRHASVVLHPVSKKGKQERGGYELKTDNDGKTEFEGVPYGPLRVQVLAEGFQTYGEDYQVQNPTMDITIKLKRPVSQYSIYGDSANSPKQETPKEQKPQ